MKEKEQLIQEESTSYNVLLYRKNRALRLWEIGVFLLALLLVAPYFEFRSLSFVIVLLLLGAGVMLAVPALYRLIYRPRYTLYSHHLLIRLGKRKDRYPLTDIQPAYDMPYIYLIQGKKIPLLVSDSFIESLNTRRNLIARGLD